MEMHPNLASSCISTHFAIWNSTRLTPPLTLHCTPSPANPKSFHSFFPCVQKSWPYHSFPTYALKIISQEHSIYPRFGGQNRVPCPPPTSRGLSIGVEIAQTCGSRKGLHKESTYNISLRSPTHKHWIEIVCSKTWAGMSVDLNSTSNMWWLRICSLLGNLSCISWCTYNTLGDLRNDRNSAASLSA